MLSLAYITTENATPIEQIEAAAAAGFDAVGLRALQPTGRPLAHELIGQPELLVQVERACRRCSMAILDLEVVTLTPRFDVAAHATFLDVAARIGAHYVQVVCEDPDFCRAGDNLARIAEAASDVGVSIALEFMAFRSVHNLQNALNLLDHAPIESAKLLIDVLHLCRSGGDARQLTTVPADKIGYVQLCDAPALAPANLIQEARGDRLYPGEGGLPLHEIYAALPIGLPISVEVPRASMIGQTARLQAMEAAKWAKDFVAGCELSAGFSSGPNQVD